MNQLEILLDKYSLTERTVFENEIIDDLLSVSGRDLRQLSSDDLENVLKLIGTLLCKVKSEAFDAHYFENTADNSVKFKTIISRLSWNMKAFLLMNAELEYDTSYYKPFTQLRTEVYYCLRSLVDVLNHFVPDFKSDYELSNDELESLFPKEKDKRKNQEKAPTSAERIMALLTLCPELEKKLVKNSKETKQRVIHLITGVNEEDSYKLAFGSDNFRKKGVQIDDLLYLKELLGK